MRQSCKHPTIIVSMLLMWIFQSVSALAVEFVIVGPRAAGMGGAGVAVTTDSLATYWNPAGLAMERTFDIRGQASAQFTDRVGINQTIKDINAINFSDTSLANQARLQALIDKLASPYASVSAAGAVGLYFKGYSGDHYFGMNVSDVATGGTYMSTVDPTVTVVGGRLTNASQVATRGLEARQIGFSYAYAFLDRTLSLGATVKVIQGAAYHKQRTLVGSSGNFDMSNLGKATISTSYGIDVGAVYRPVSWFQAGIVGKDLNAPEFDAPQGQKFQLNPQFRGGVAVKPYETLTLTADGDINKNSTLVPTIKSRVISVGAEQTLFSKGLALRAGAFKNVEDANSYITPTAGLGVRLWAFSLDVGAGYDFRQRGALGSIALGFTW
ncbi:MAG TPA: conjugal transfer protein TraF [Nitrospiraceae bacterium]|nr:conjugal transfer protein TraF [Nitrospiraceae bacterium]